MSAQPKHGNNYDLIDTLISAAKGWPSNSWRIRVKWGGKTTFPVDQGEDGRASILNHHSVLYNGSNHCTWAKSKSLFPIFFLFVFAAQKQMSVQLSNLRSRRKPTAAWTLWREKSALNEKDANATVVAGSGGELVYKAGSTSLSFLMLKISQSFGFGLSN